MYVASLPKYWFPWVVSSRYWWTCSTFLHWQFRQQRPYGVTEYSWQDPWIAQVQKLSSVARGDIATHRHFDQNWVEHTLLHESWENNCGLRRWNKKYEGKQNDPDIQNICMIRAAGIPNLISCWLIKRMQKGFTYYNHRVPSHHLRVCWDTANLGDQNKTVKYLTYGQYHW